MTDKLISCEIWIAMNDEGDWVAVDESDDPSALEKLTNEYGGAYARVVKVTVKMSPPAEVDAEVTVPEEAGTVTATAA